jgi:hypothetical protein
MFAAFSLSTLIASSQVLGDVLYSFDFNAGLPEDWINESTSIAAWEYRGPQTIPSNAIGSIGSCASGNLPLASQTQANGFMIFDSNYWDDPGTSCGAGFGQGPAPAPHDVSLITPSLDFTGVTSVVLTFQQQYRHFQATTEIDISTDDGISWTNVGVNSGSISPNVEWKTINISGVAANAPNIKIRFHFSGTYYWWQLDDINFYSANDNDLLLVKSFYTNNTTPENIYNMMEYGKYPQNMLPQLRFKGSITNIGGLIQNSVVLNTKLINSLGTVVNQQNSSSSNLSPGQTIALLSPNSFTPSNAIDDYIVAYQVNQAQTDENLENNLDTLDFSITAHTWARDEGVLEDTYNPVGQFVNERYEIGNIYYGFGTTRNCTSVSVGIAEGTLPGGQMKAIIYDESYSVVLAESEVYTINSADINAIGEEFMVTLPLITSLGVYADSVYYVMVQSLDANYPFRIGRAGEALESTSFIKFYDLNALFYLTKIPMVRMNMFNTGIVAGCLDPTAMNYNSEATQSDSSCRYPGCTIETASNYNPSANWDDGSCAVQGCTDPTAFNYNPLATEDDGSCVNGGCTNPAASNYDPTAQVDDGSCLIEGCTNASAENFNPEATVDDGSCIIYGCTDPEADNYNPEATINENCEYWGCTNPTADNFDPQANVDDGSCVILGCTDFEANNYNPNATEDDGTCIYAGCTDPEADNYNPMANQDDGSCAYLGCTNPTADNFDPQANVDDGTCIISGCMDPNASNYNPEANTDNATCEYLGCTDVNASNYNEFALEDDGSCLYPGCTNPEASNFDPMANVNDGSCLFDQASFSIDVMSGCAPLTLTITNSTGIASGGICTYLVDGIEIASNCASVFQITIEEEGIHTLEYIYTVDDVSTSAVIEGIEVFALPVVPSISLNESTSEVECTGCTDLNTSWYIDGDLTTLNGANVSALNQNQAFDNGFYHVLVTDANGCSNQSENLLVFELSLSFDQLSSCGEALVEVMNITDLPDGASASIDWGTGLGEQSINNGENSFTYNNAGTFIIDVEMTWGSSVASESYEVIVNALPTPFAFYDAVAGTVYCQNCSAGDQVWIIDGQQTTNTPPLSASIGSVYQLLYTDENGCTGESEVIVDKVTEGSDFDFSIYPNPATDKITISATTRVEEIIVYNSAGQIVIQSNTHQSNKNQLDISNLKGGLYEIVLRTATNSSRQSMVVIR